MSGRYLCLTKAAGRLSFEPNQTMDFPDDVAAELLLAGAIQDLQPVVVSEKSEPQPEAKPEKAKK